MQIRPAALHEIPAVVSLGRRAYEWATGKTDFDEAVSAGNWINLVNSGEGVVFVIAEESRVLGFICGYKSRNIDTGKLVAQMWHWFVETEARGHGVYLLRRFEAWAVKQGCQEVSITCFPQLWTDKHRGIYERMGYKLEGMIFMKES